MNQENSSKSVLITGGAGDIGLAVARQMAAREFDIAVLDVISTQVAEERLAPLRDQGVNVLYLEADVRDRQMVETALTTLWNTFERLDVCVCNAGVANDQPFADVSVEEWQRHIDINLNGYFHVSQAVARRWIAEKHQGKFIFMGSWVQDVPYQLITPYCVSKAGVWMLARCMAIELAPHGITTNVVAPGILDAGLSKQEMEEHPEFREKFSRIIPRGRMQTPDDVANVVTFLTSAQADYLTGSSILCDGGCLVGAPSMNMHEDES